MGENGGETNSRFFNLIKYEASQDEATVKKEKLLQLTIKSALTVGVLAHACKDIEVTGFINSDFAIIQVNLIAADVCEVGFIAVGSLVWTIHSLKFTRTRWQMLNDLGLIAGVLLMTIGDASVNTLPLINHAGKISIAGGIILLAAIMDESIRQLLNLLTDRELFKRDGVVPHLADSHERALAFIEGGIFWCFGGMVAFMHMMGDIGYEYFVSQQLNATSTLAVQALNSTSAASPDGVLGIDSMQMLFIICASAYYMYKTAISGKSISWLGKVNRTILSGAAVTWGITEVLRPLSSTANEVINGISTGFIGITACAELVRELYDIVVRPDQESMPLLDASRV